GELAGERALEHRGLGGPRTRHQLARDQASLREEGDLGRVVRLDDDAHARGDAAEAERDVVGERRGREPDAARLDAGLLERVQVAADDLARHADEQHLDAFRAERPHRVVPVDLLARQRHEVLHLVLEHLRQVLLGGSREQYARHRRVAPRHAEDRVAGVDLLRRHEVAHRVRERLLALDGLRTRRQDDALGVAEPDLQETLRNARERDVGRAHEHPEAVEKIRPSHDGPAAVLVGSSAAGAAAPGPSLASGARSSHDRMSGRSDSLLPSCTIAMTDDWLRSCARSARASTRTNSGSTICTRPPSPGTAVSISCWRKVLMPSGSCPRPATKSCASEIVMDGTSARTTWAVICPALMTSSLPRGYGENTSTSPGESSWP